MREFLCYGANLVSREFEGVDWVGVGCYNQQQQQQQGGGGQAQQRHQLQQQQVLQQQQLQQQQQQAQTNNNNNGNNSSYVDEMDMDDLFSSNKPIRPQILFSFLVGWSSFLDLSSWFRLD